ncbi:hypothetical protein V502_09380 [Pseudogymnoascus sp. VKM F-4520 (FW-2644)]|nr:hypothetical protein V502_09380 [Pseudogymnoascus sp. VKM F-4520 (FW-2644)]
MSALSAPSSPEEVHTLSIAILVVSVFSALGAGWIILSFIAAEEFPPPAHPLQRVHGAALRSAKYTPLTPFQVLIHPADPISAADYWVLTIAVYTYLILANHKHLSTWVQDHKLTIWVLPWLLSTLWATIGLAVVGPASRQLHPEVAYYYRHTVPIY